MAIIARNKSGKEVELIEPGSYPGRIYQMVHVGTISGFEGKMQNKVRVGIELPTELHVFDEAKGPQPRVISQSYTLSFNEKATLRKLITACDPDALKTDADGFLAEEFDVESLVGKPLLVTVAHKPKKDGTGNFAFIDAVTRLPKGMECPPAVNPPVVLSYDKWNQAVFETLPEFLRKDMESTPEFALMRDGAAAIAKDGDAPF